MWLREFFYIQKSDRRVILVLLGVAAVALSLMWLAGGEPEDDALLAADSTAVSRADSIPKERQPYYRVEERPVERFAFDPNTADSTQLLRLGLQPWQVRNIYKYRAAGGVYRQKEDFARLYGLTQKQYKELEPYIRISSDYQPAAALVAPRESRDTLRYPVKLKEGETVDLSVADTSALCHVPGIGSYYARRVVQYGERLGGYVNVRQLLEIDGFPESALPFLTIGNAKPRRTLNLNRLSLDELKRHPYLNYYQARAIVDYRRQHGRIASLDDLRLLRDFPQEAIDRLRPYVTY